MTPLMSIPGNIDPVPVTRPAEPRPDGKIDLVGLSKAEMRAALTEAGLDAKGAGFRCAEGEGGRGAQYDWPRVGTVEEQGEVVEAEQVPAGPPDVNPLAPGAADELGKIGLVVGGTGVAGGPDTGQVAGKKFEVDVQAGSEAHFGVGHNQVVAEGVQQPG